MYEIPGACLLFWLKKHVTAARTPVQKNSPDNSRDVTKWNIIGSVMCLFYCRSELPNHGHRAINNGRMLLLNNGKPVAYPKRNF